MFTKEEQHAARDLISELAGKPRRRADHARLIAAQFVLHASSPASIAAYTEALLAEVKRRGLRASLEATPV
jgi:hypothetical protein